MILARNTGTLKTSSLGGNAEKATDIARAEAITSEREGRMRQIAAIRADRSTTTGFADKAQTLLTRDWAKASWRSRSQILRTVDWLLRLERTRQRVGAGPC
jgi:hypothetical protein